MLELNSDDIVYAETPAAPRATRWITVDTHFVLRQPACPPRHSSAPRCQLTTHVADQLAPVTTSSSPSVPHPRAAVSRSRAPAPGRYSRGAGACAERQRSTARARGSVQRAPGLYGALQAARYASRAARRGDTHHTPAPRTRTTTSTSSSFSCSATQCAQVWARKLLPRTFSKIRPGHSLRFFSLSSLGESLMHDGRGAPPPPALVRSVALLSTD